MKELNSRRPEKISESAARPTRKLACATASIALAVGLMSASAYAQDAQPAQQTPVTPGPILAQAAPAAPAKAPPAWADGITSSFWIEGGYTYNSVHKSGDRNFGRSFDDGTNDFRLNQAAITVQRKIDSSKPDYDFGFKFQGIYGTDARYEHFLNEFDSGSEYQFDIVEANLQWHTPWFTDGGYDIKAGQYPTLEGIETIDPTANYLYSHSYIFNYGIPYKHTGVITVLHATPVVDLYFGFDTGVNNTVGQGDVNGHIKFHGGIGLNLLGGNLTVLATTHIGPENAKNAVRNGLAPAGANNANRYLNDVSTTWKLNDKFQLLNDLNYIQDDCTAASGVGVAKCETARAYGVAQYGVYQLNDIFTLVGRAEVWRDEEGFFVTQFNNDNDPVRSEEGLPLLGTSYPASANTNRTTYGGFTAGVNIKPPVTIPMSGSLVIRPEVRYDTSLNNTKPFGDNTKGSQVTVASDFILQF